MKICEHFIHSRCKSIHVTSNPIIWYTHSHTHTHTPRYIIIIIIWYVQKKDDDLLSSVNVIGIIQLELTEIKNNNHIRVHVVL